MESASGQGSPSKSELRSLIAGLGKRVFLAHNVHERSPATFQTRWAKNYLRGPLTRTQIQRLQPLASHEIEEAPAPLSRFGAVPGVINTSWDLKLFEKELSDYLYRNEKLPIYYNPKLKVYSRPGESDREFRFRLDQLAREERDEAVSDIEDKPITPRRTDIKIDLLALAWVPQWEFEYQLDSGRTRSTLVRPVGTW